MSSPVRRVEKPRTRKEARKYCKVHQAKIVQSVIDTGSKTLASRVHQISINAVNTALVKSGKTDLVGPGSVKRASARTLGKITGGPVTSKVQSRRSSPRPDQPPIVVPGSAPVTIQGLAREVLRQAVDAVQRVDQAEEDAKHFRAEMERYRIECLDSRSRAESAEHKLSVAQKEVENVRWAYNELVKDSNINGLPASVDELMLLIRRKQSPGKTF